ncbi:hypothetical protein [Hymenobacter volaticus]|uniref:Uncharacterized protein n=1 Tax=Hymenobacter volaticus TaxID=2932254 RepID=A0ABY4GG15_9BACT|nr:hypothetical protein [Hymenobacter volaticus]UOQ69915.1 hypothetical protein MUN86_30925 [Hymenobacter volaticus]
MRPYLLPVVLCLAGLLAPLTRAATAPVLIPPAAQAPLLRYQVTRIDSLRTVYLIYARRHDSLFKIVSDKQLVEPCTKITPGATYAFQLRSLLFTDLTPQEKAASLPGLVPFDTHHMGGLDYDGQGLIISLEGDSISDLYYAKNVRGLCFQP